MKDIYVEWMVKKRRTWVDGLIRAASIFAIIICVLLFLLTAKMLFFFVIVAAGVGAYFVFGYTDVEYEYVYVSGELSIDRILSKSRRKRIERFDTGRIEIVAPLKSHRLDGFANRKCREYDYTSGVRTQNSHIFVLYTEGKRVLLEPNYDLVKALKDTMPHKVHMDM